MPTPASPPESPRLAELLRQAAAIGPMTPRQLWLQRVSFAHGNVSMETGITREMVERVATDLYGPCPAI